MVKFQFFLLPALAALTVPAVGANPQCPGNVESVPLRLANRYQMIVQVAVNNSGPYDFLLDTGTQVTVIDQALADELNLKANAKAALVGAGARNSADFSRVESIAIGNYKHEGETVVLYDLSSLKNFGRQIRGILGEGFLVNFDTLIDVAHSSLCLGDSKRLQSAVNGTHIPLLISNQTGPETALPRPLVVAVHPSDGMHLVHLKLDSGTNQAFLYDAEKIIDLRYYHGRMLSGSAINGVSRNLLALPAQDIQIGSLHLSQIQFVTLAGVQKDATAADFDGMLALSPFKRVFICHKGGYVVLEPR